MYCYILLKVDLLSFLKTASYYSLTFSEFLLLLNWHFASAWRFGIDIVR